MGDTGHEGKLGRAIRVPYAVQPPFFNWVSLEKVLVIFEHELFDNGPDKMLEGTKMLLDRSIGSTLV